MTSQSPDGKASVSGVLPPSPASLSAFDFDTEPGDSNASLSKNFAEVASVRKLLQVGSLEQLRASSQEPDVDDVPIHNSCELMESDMAHFVQHCLLPLRQTTMMGTIRGGQAAAWVAMMEEQQKWQDLKVLVTETRKLVRLKLKRQCLSKDGNSLKKKVETLHGIQKEYQVFLEALAPPQEEPDADKDKGIRRRIAKTIQKAPKKTNSGLSLSKRAQDYVVKALAADFKKLTDELDKSQKDYDLNKNDEMQCMNTKFTLRASLSAAATFVERTIITSSSLAEKWSQFEKDISREGSVGFLAFNVGPAVTAGTSDVVGPKVAMELVKGNLVLDFLKNNLFQMVESHWEGQKQPRRRHVHSDATSFAFLRSLVPVVIGRTDLAGMGYDIAGAIAYDPLFWRGNMDSDASNDVPSISLTINPIAPPLTSTPTATLTLQKYATHSHLTVADRLDGAALNSKCQTSPRGHRRSSNPLIISSRAKKGALNWDFLRTLRGSGKLKGGGRSKDTDSIRSKKSELTTLKTRSPSMAKMRGSTYEPQRPSLLASNRYSTVATGSTSKQILRTYEGGGLLMSGCVVNYFVFKSSSVDIEEDEKGSHQMCIKIATHIFIDYSKLAPPGYTVVDPSQRSDVLLFYFLLRKSLSGRSKKDGGFARGGNLPRRAVLSIMAFVDPCWFASVWREYRCMDPSEV